MNDNDRWFQAYCAALTGLHGALTAFSVNDAAEWARRAADRAMVDYREHCAKDAPVQAESRDGGGCDLFERGAPNGTCEGDGYYECKECVRMRFEPPRAAGGDDE